MKNRKIAVLSVLCLALFAACFGLDMWTRHTPTGSVPATAPTATPEVKEYSISLVAVGDNLLHMPVINSCEQEDGTYNMQPLYEHVRPMIESADIAVVGQETVLGGAEFAYSGYPAFNSPQDAGRALVDTGFDVVLLASNHAMDMGKKGLLNMLNFWKQYPDIVTVGANATPEEQAQIRIVDKGIRIAMLNYTYGLNGIKLGADRAHLVDLIDKERIRADVEKAKTQSDFIIAFMHWGKEYILDAQPEQQELAQFMADLGVDLIIGAHPHVLEPAEWLTGINGNRTLVYYSLGNFMSSQREIETVLGGMARLEIYGVADAAGNIQTQIRAPELVPLVTYYDRNLENFTVYPLKAYTDEIAKTHGVAKYDGDATPARFREIVDRLYPLGCGVNVDD